MYNYSIILPYYDKYNLFVKAFDSIPDRTDIQIIIIDNSKKTLDKEDIPSKTKALVTYSTSDNTKGAGHARNVGLSLVKGKYILFCDADDYFTETAFDSFDQYVGKDFDIVFFKSDSLYLKSGKRADRHETYNYNIDAYLQQGNEDLIRYRYEAPWGKLFKSSFIKNNENIRFEETRVNNDSWFSFMAGHYASQISASSDVVYLITEGERGSSLTQIKNFDNLLIRYTCAIRINKFLKQVNKYQVHIRLLGFIRIAFKEFGVKQGIRLCLLAIKNHVSVF